MGRGPPFPHRIFKKGRFGGFEPLASRRGGGGFHKKIFFVANFPKRGVGVGGGVGFSAVSLRGVVVATVLGGVEGRWSGRFPNSSIRIRRKFPLGKSRRREKRKQMFLRCPRGDFFFRGQLMPWREIFGGFVVSYSSRHGIGAGATYPLGGGIFRRCRMKLCGPRPGATDPGAHGPPRVHGWRFVAGWSP